MVPLGTSEIQRKFTLRRWERPLWHESEGAFTLVTTSCFLTSTSKFNLTLKRFSRWFFLLVGVKTRSSPFLDVVKKRSHRHNRLGVTLQNTRQVPFFLFTVVCAEIWSIVRREPFFTAPASDFVTGEYSRSLFSVTLSRSRSTLDVATSYLPKKISRSFLRLRVKTLPATSIVSVGRLHAKFVLVVKGHCILLLFLFVCAVKRFSHGWRAVDSLTSASKFNVEANSGIFNVSAKTTACHPMWKALYTFNIRHCHSSRAHISAFTFSFSTRQATRAGILRVRERTSGSVSGRGTAHV